MACWYCGFYGVLTILLNTGTSLKVYSEVMFLNGLEERYYISSGAGLSLLAGQAE